MRPKVTLENSEEVYQFYTDYRPNKIANRLGHLGMSLAFRPRVSYDPGAPEAITEMLQSGTRILMAINHLRFIDQFTIASMAQREKVLRPMTGNTFIPAKKSLYNPALRYGLDIMGAVPTFRAKDVLNRDGSVDEVKTLPRKLATKRLIATSIERINDGNHMAIFPEGTRNDEEDADVTRLQRLSPGIGIIACGLDQDVNYALLPVGMFYGRHGEPTKTNHPYVHIGRPIPGPFSSPNEVLETLGPAMQTTVYQALNES